MKHNLLIGLSVFTLASCAGGLTDITDLSDQTIPTTSTRMIQTNTTRIIDTEMIDMLASQNIQDIVNLQAGIDNGRVRGGRSGEIIYYVDGIPVKDLYTGGNFIENGNQHSFNQAAIQNDINANHSNSSSAYYDRIRVYRSEQR